VTPKSRNARVSRDWPAGRHPFRYLAGVDHKLAGHQDVAGADAGQIGVLVRRAIFKMSRIEEEDGES
jgi:hypothetical protein